MPTGRTLTDDPVGQTLDRLGSLGVPVGEIAERAGAIASQIGALDPFEVLDAVTSIDPSQIDVGEIAGELRMRYDALDPALKLPIALAAGFVGARVVRWIVR